MSNSEGWVRVIRTPQMETLGVSNVLTWPTPRSFDARSLVLQNQKKYGPLAGPYFATGLVGCLTAAFSNRKDLDGFECHDQGVCTVGL